MEDYLIFYNYFDILVPRYVNKDDVSIHGYFYNNFSNAHEYFAQYITKKLIKDNNLKVYENNKLIEEFDFVTPGVHKITFKTEDGMVYQDRYDVRE